MQSILTLLAENQLLLLFVIIGLGYLVGNIRIAGFQLGVVSVLFAGILLGALDNRLGLPEYIYVIGLVLFVYAIGLQSGPGFFGSFRRRGLSINIIVVLILAGGALLAVLLGKFMGLTAPTIAGLFCGALTNTPALAGLGFTQTLRAGGFSLILLAGLITTAVSIATIVIGYKFLKLPMAAVMGMMSGMQTQPACLAYANQQVANEVPNVWYATVYPGFHGGQDPAGTDYRVHSVEVDEQVD